MRYDRITIDIEQMNGEPCIRNPRIPVATIVSMIAQGISFDQIHKNYPDLEKKDIEVALEFSADAV